MNQVNSQGAWSFLKVKENSSVSLTHNIDQKSQNLNGQHAPEEKELDPPWGLQVGIRSAQDQDQSRDR